ncbi:Por secretion system C-terminal sorting domain-containing protein [Lishizhenia tianjinensis]|uniref:Por secretion system C-terminal sorting domain-containing protein n=1 Tax=Lishizhenia tianjinensis TaxID=477690 RepID=A0A1I6YLU1_9FLAO|nr:T9SS type A sorting domain-containing protein [Lishizhenia tianjinensis]SFT51392.1 Por secretion system C-terminal sorting domain-containing protein [Lishizhenia tianjinensis]
MKRNKLLLGTLSVAAIASAAMVWYPSSSEESQYTPKSLQSFESYSALSERQEWFQARLIDHQTGEVATPEKIGQIMEQYKYAAKSNVIKWQEEGPANIGGRTRAILIDHQDENNVWAGSVSGGLWYSPWKANYWTRVQNFPGTNFISSMAQDQSGNIYVATGLGSAYSEDLQGLGNGLWMSPDKGATWSLVPGTDSYNVIIEVVGCANSNTIYFTTQTGLRKYTSGATQTESVDLGTPGSISALKMSNDGMVIVAAVGTRTHVSTDGGSTWENRAGNGTGEIIQSFGRVEYAISHERVNGKYKVYAALTYPAGGSPTSGTNAGQWLSVDNGITWEQHTPPTAADPLNIYSNQGVYNSTASFDPTDADRVIIGGIDLWEWQQQVASPAAGSWDKISEWFRSPQDPLYVHADNHELKWSNSNTLYVGNDGGVGRSSDLGTTFTPANRGFNATQFYDIAYGLDMSVIGGAQDNGTLYNDHTNATYQDFIEFSGGDGFDCAISSFNPNVVFSSLYYQVIYRSADRGESVSPMPLGLPASIYGTNGLGGTGTHYFFHTQMELAEYYDENSEDSVLYVPLQSYAAGDALKVPSASTGDTIDYITPIDLRYDDTLYYNPSLTGLDYLVEDSAGNQFDLGQYPYTAITGSGYPPAVGDSIVIDLPAGMDTVIVEGVTAYDHYYGSNSINPSEIYDMGMDTIAIGVAWDTLTVQDPFQSWFVIATTNNGGELWGTRDALRFAEQNPKWVRIAENLGSVSAGSINRGMDVEFSEDLNHMFVVAGGQLHRIDGLGSVYSSDDDFELKCDLDEGATATSVVQFSGANSLRALGIDHKNPDLLVVTQAGVNNGVFKSTNGTSATPTLTQVGTEAMPIYDVVIERNNSQLLVAATYNGAMVSEDGGATWSVAAGGKDLFEGTPAFTVEQNWRDENYLGGNPGYGEIYIGTFGRGIFKTTSTVNVEETTSNNPMNEKVEKEVLTIYPNPSSGYAAVVLNDVEASNATIYFYNLAGTVVKTVDAKGLVKGKNKVNFDASNLPNGTYIIKVAGQSATGKFVKL